MAHSFPPIEKYEYHQQEGWEMLKIKITNHPLYALLVQTHMDCLKVSGGTIDMEEKIAATTPSLSGVVSRSELDYFMEAYCYVLSKLKEAIEEPQQETMAFINSMHSELKDLTTTHSNPVDHEPPSPSSGSNQ